MRDTAQEARSVRPSTKSAECVHLLRTRIRNGSPSHEDRSDYVRIPSTTDLRLRKVVDGAEGCITRVVHHNVDVLEFREGRIDFLAVGHVELCDQQLVTETFTQISELFGLAKRSGDAISALKQLLGHDSPKTGDLPVVNQVLVIFPRPLPTGR